MTYSTGNKPSSLSQDLVQALDNINGLHPGYRPAHAKGIMFSGTFTPSPEAASLTRAPHIQHKSTPVTVRFSNSAGIPDIPDNHPQGASPRGIAIRFHLADHVHTDIIAHSHNGFPVRTPEEFLEMLQAVAASASATARPTPIEAFLGTHPSALRFVQAPKPIPTSFARESFFGVNAFQFTNQESVSRYGRYRILPAAWNEHLDEAAAAAKSPNFLFDEIVERVKREPVQLKIVVQLAESGDPVNDATIQWADDRPQLEFGTIVLTERIADEDHEKRRVIFDPIPRVDGIEPSDDPLLQVRADVYLFSGRRRRAATEK
jgi:catalase